MKSLTESYRLIIALLMAVLYSGCCPMNPKVNSVITAHGNTDWHIDTAEEFLTGSDMNGNTTATNHCPDTWSKNHMHVGLSNTNSYYYDRGQVLTGQDAHLTNGIDRAMLFFYAGHGCPTYFNTLGNSAQLTEMRLGNCDDLSKGILRYYWQCSCEVFAHGPRVCPGETWEYTCPEDFDGSPDSYSMRNVYERWGPNLSPELRMACGSSSAAYCHEGETNRIWDYYNNQGYDVADAFIFGLHRYDWNTPLCITTGGRYTSQTPLFDQTFTNQPNPSGPYLHIQYLSEFDSNVPLQIIEIPVELPIYYFIPLPLPEFYQRYEFQDQEEWMYSSNKLKTRDQPLVKVNKNSGSVYVFGERSFREDAPVLSDSSYLETAKKFLEKQGWAEREMLEPVGERMVMERAPETGNYKDSLVVSQKNVVISFRRQIEIGGRYYNTVGEGGQMIVQLNNDGSLYNASKVWRKIEGVKRTAKTKDYDQAFAEAVKQIAERDAYKLDSWIWGFEEHAGNVRQDELKAVYIFNFAPIDMERVMEIPPRAIKVSAYQ